MRLLTFNKQGTPSLGIEIDEIVIDLSISDPELPKNMIVLIGSYPALINKLNEIANIPKHEAILYKDKIEYLPPIPNPSKIICVGLNYNDHIAETKKEKPKYPVLFARYTSTLTAHNQAIVKPICSDKCDYEGELAVIIGKTAKHVKKEQAAEYIFGYSIFNDVTVRDYQGRTSQFLLGKNFDQTGSFGPVIVTHDEFIEGVPDLRIRTILNGNTMQDDATSNMIFTIHELIENITEAITLKPGDVIITGTPAGVGYTRQPPIYLKDGDECIVEIENIGKLRNIIKNEQSSI
jgi:2-keto-4-pentenoate hydratase/2-oxohepta-3-ene-1,7-dioic acid hydratase in catechol pathway